MTVNTTLKKKRTLRNFIIKKKQRAGSLKNKSVRKKTARKSRRKHKKQQKRHRRQRGGNPYRLEKDHYIMIHGGFEFTPESIRDNTLSAEQTVEALKDTIDIFKTNGMTTNVGKMTGCYCPPHKGHYESILNACKELDLRVLFLSSNNRPGASRSRHGMPSEFSAEQLCIFAKQIYMEMGENIVIFVTAGSSLSTPWEIESNMDKFFIISSFEYDDEESKQLAIQSKALEEAVDPLAKVFPKVFRKFKRSTPEQRQTKVSNKIFLRDKKEGFSATKFTKCLIELRDQLETAGGDKRALYNKCYYFLPDFYTEEMKYNYIETAMNYKEHFVA